MGNKKEKKSTEAKEKYGRQPKTLLQKLLGPALLIGSMSMVYVLKQGFIFFMMALMPAFSAFVTDIHNNKLRFQVVFACNLAGAWPYILPLLHASDASMVSTTMGDYTMWLIIYSTASVGWILIWVCPAMVGLVFKAQNASAVESHKEAQKKLMQEWGSDIQHMVFE